MSVTVVIQTACVGRKFFSERACPVRSISIPILTHDLEPDVIAPAQNQE
jgi:hypothetical protein